MYACIYVYICKMYVCMYACNATALGLQQHFLWAQQEHVCAVDPMKGGHACTTMKFCSLEAEVIREPTCAAAKQK